MNVSPAETPTLAGSPCPDAGWNPRKWFFVLALAITAHLALVFLFGASKAPAPRTVANVPQFHLLRGHDAILAFNDPTLFVLPHEDLDFMPAAWRSPMAVDEPAFRWIQTDQSSPVLTPTADEFGTIFSAFMQTNQFVNLELDFKPEPRFTTPVFEIEPALPQKSTLQITGDLAQRQLAKPIQLPSLPWNDVLPPVRVQALVDETGNVMSAVLLESSGLELADTQAIAIANAAKFTPATGLKFGELIFNWHTVPTNAP